MKQRSISRHYTLDIQWHPLSRCILLLHTWHSLSPRHYLQLSQTFLPRNLCMPTWISPQNLVNIYQRYTICSQIPCHFLRSSSRCPVGTYSPSEGLSVSVCTQCVPGKYSSTEGNMSDDACVLCGQGTFASTRGSSTCQNCPPGIPYSLNWPCCPL